MNLSDNKGIKTPRWVANEIMTSEDLSALANFAYKNYTDLVSLIANKSDEASPKDTILGGLLLKFDANLTCDVLVGMGISFSGYYLDSLQNWGFIASAGDIFSIVVPEDTAVTFDGGGGSDRIDIVEIRPLRTAYATEDRHFKNPVTGIITTGPITTKYHFSSQIQIVKGTEGAGVAPTATAGWIKIAEVTVGAGVSVLSDGVIDTYLVSDTWTTGAGDTVLINAPDHNHDSEYYTKTLLDGGQLDNRYFTETEHIDTSAGGGDVGKPIKLNSGGQVDSTMLPAGGGAIELTITAGETVAAEDPMGINEDGWMKVVKDIITSESQFTSGANVCATPWVAQLGASQFVVVWKDTSNNHIMFARIGSYASGAIVWDTAQTQVSAGTNSAIYARVCSYNDTYFVCAWKDSNAATLFVRVGHESGGSIVWDTSETDVGFVGTPGGTNALALTEFEPGYFAVAGVDSGANSSGFVRVGHESGGSIIWDTSVTQFSSGANTIHSVDISALGSDKFIIAWVDTIASAAVFIRIGYNNAGTIAWDISQLQVSTTAACTYSAVAGFRSADNRFVVVWTLNAGSIGYLSLGRLVGSAVQIDQAQVEFSDNCGFNTMHTFGGNEIVLIYNTVGTTYESLMQLIKVSDYGITFGLLYELVTAYNSTVTCGAPFGDGKIAVVWLASVGQVGYARLFEWTRFLAVAAEAITISTAGAVQIGNYMDLFAGLTIGKRYSVDYAGQQIGEGGEEYLGTAISATEIVR